MAIHQNDERGFESGKELELVDPPLILSSSPIFRKGKVKHFQKNNSNQGFDESIKNISRNSDVDMEEDESTDSDENYMEEDDEEIGAGGSLDEEGNMTQKKPVRKHEEKDHDVELGDLGVDDGVVAASSEGLPARLPVFHASTLGRWHAMISYDACLRLCHRSWAMGCSEASVFVDNEFRLLRTAFGLKHVLLKPEVELLAIRSSMPSNIFSAPKPKKTINRFMVQVRKVQMDLASPKGCIFSSFHPSKTYSCILRLSSNDDEKVRMQPGSGETHSFFPDSVGDVLFLEVQDSKRKHYGRVVAQMDTFIEEPGGKVRWFPIYREPEHEHVGKIQLFIEVCSREGNHSSSIDENGCHKCGLVSESVAYDFVLEVAMKAQRFKQRNLLLHGEWKWLIAEFVSYYGVSNAYANLRYLSYVMDVATPTSDCLVLVYDLLYPIISARSTLSCQENRMLEETEDQLERVLSLALKNYKALDESSLSGMLDVFRPATETPAPALAPAVKLYNLLHDTTSADEKLKLCGYFQVAAKKRSRRHLAKMDEFVTSNGGGKMMDVVTLSSAYQKMKSLCLNIRNEIFTDIKIHNQHVLPSFIDLPNISSAIYSLELCNRLRAFLVACPPQSPSSPVTELVIATADFQKDLISWNINHVKGGVDAKELFHLYIISWIQDKCVSLLQSCKVEKVKWSGVRTQNSSSPSVEDMYDRLKETLSEYEIILRRWPEYTVVLETAIADAEKALVDALEKQYADVLSPLKDNPTPKNIGLRYVQKLANRSAFIYEVPGELGVFLNSIKRMMDMLCPSIETHLKSLSSYIPPSGDSTVQGERLSEVMIMLRFKLKSYQQAIVEKLAENTKVQNVTKVKKLLQEFKETVTEPDVRSRIQPLKDQFTKTMDHLHSVFETHLFVDICRGYWERMGQYVLSFLDNGKENRACHKGARIAVSILDDTFASQMRQLLGNALQEKDLATPRSIVEVYSVLYKDAVNHRDSNYYH